MFSNIAPLCLSARGRFAALLCVVLMLGGAAAAQRADAAAYTISVSAPKRINTTQIQGVANLSRDCSGTLGCSNYIKIERQRWWGVEYVKGWWANANGWNSITADLPSGCYDYRTTVDSYNDVAGSYGTGVNVGQVGVSSSGTKVYRFRTTWSSGFARHCR